MRPRSCAQKRLIVKPDDRSLATDWCGLERAVACPWLANLLDSWQIHLIAKGHDVCTLMTVNVLATMSTFEAVSQLMRPASGRTIRFEPRLSRVRVDKRLYIARTGADADGLQMKANCVDKRIVSQEGWYPRAV